MLALNLVSAVILTIFLSSCAVAQEAISLTSNPDLVVLKKQWRFEVRNRTLERDPNEEARAREMEEERRKDIERLNETLSAQGMPVRDVPTRPLRRETRLPGPTLTYTYQVKLRNVGRKRIESIVWEYVFFEPGTQEELGRHRFVSKMPISSGQTRTLSVRSTLPPTGTIEAAKENVKPTERYSEKIEIVRVGYADDSQWHT